MAENAQLRLRMETDLGRAALSDLLQRMSAKVNMHLSSHSQTCPVVCHISHTSGAALIMYEQPHTAHNC